MPAEKLVWACWHRTNLTQELRGRIKINEFFSRRDIFSLFVFQMLMMFVIVWVIFLLNPVSQGVSVTHELEQINAATIHEADMMDIGLLWSWF